MDDTLKEALERLEALERRVEALERTGPRCSFHEEERRIVDTIVRLTTENVVRALEERMSEGRRHGHGPPHHGHGHGHGPPHGHGPGPGHGPPDHRR